MKKKLLSLFFTALCTVSLLAGCGSQKDGGNVSSAALTPVTLNEVAHSMECVDNDNIES